MTRTAGLVICFLMGGCSNYYVGHTNCDATYEFRIIDTKEEQKYLCSAPGARTEVVWSETISSPEGAAKRKEK